MWLKISVAGVLTTVLFVAGIVAWKEAPPPPPLPAVLELERLFYEQAAALQEVVLMVPLTEDELLGVCMTLAERQARFERLTRSLK